VQPLRFVAIDSAFEVHALESPGGSSPAGGASALCLVEADRRRLVARVAPAGTPGELAVTSVVFSHGRLLLGRRRGLPHGRPGAWELVASEPLDEAFLDPRTARVDFRGALLARLVECAPLARPPRARLVPFALAHDLQAQRWSLCLALELSPGAQSCADIERASTPDYEAFRFVRPVDVIEAGADGADELDALSAALVRLPRVDASVA
jgi:hypothetical protein